MPFDDMCDNFLLFIAQERKIATIPKILLLIFLTTKQGTPISERHCNSIIKHKLSKPPRVSFRQMARIELCRLPFSF